MCAVYSFFFFLNDTATTEIYTLSLHDALRILFPPEDFAARRAGGESSGIATAAGENLCFATQFAALFAAQAVKFRSEEHTSELQSQSNLVCRLLLEKKKN